MIAQGPLVQPPPPNLAIDPTTDRGPADAVLGPFTVNGDSGQSVTVAATGASMFSDAAGTTAIPTNSTVPVGQQIWLKASGLSASSATLTATGVATVPTGNVFLYDGNTPGVNDAQRLILAETGEITVTVQATAEFFDTGSRLVSKTIDGPRRRPAGRDRHPGGVQRGAAGQLRHPGRRHRQPEHHLFRHRNPGHLHDHRDVRRREQRRPRGDGERHAGRRPAGRRRPGRSHLRRPVGNTYEPTPGSLVVTKTIAGSAARRQGEVVINVSCTNGLNQDIVIPAGTTADTTQTLDGLPAGTECTITETADGVTVGTSVSTVIGADPITIPAGTRVGVAVTNTCSLVSRDTTEPSTPSTSSEPVVPTSPTDASGNGSELPETGVSPELFMAGLIGALFVGVGAIPLVAGRRRGQEPSHRAGD